MTCVTIISRLRPQSSVCCRVPLLVLFVLKNTAQQQDLVFSKHNIARAMQRRVQYKGAQLPDKLEMLKNC
eukprot:15644-Heterococcus_DN1.PRE.2